MLYNRWLMDMPKIMDICVLYGGSNHGLTNQLVTRLFTLQPKYAEDVASMVPALVGNISELQERCMDLAHKALQAKADASGAALVQELAGKHCHADVMHGWSMCVASNCRRSCSGDHGALLTGCPCAWHAALL